MVDLNPLSLPPPHSFPFLTKRFVQNLPLALLLRPNDLGSVRTPGHLRPPGAQKVTGRWGTGSGALTGWRWQGLGYASTPRRAQGDDAGRGGICHLCKPQQKTHSSISCKHGRQKEKSSRFASCWQKGSVMLYLISNTKINTLRDVVYHHNSWVKRCQTYPCQMRQDMTPGSGYGADFSTISLS